MSSPEQLTLFNAPPPIMGEWESVANAYQRELEMLRPIIDAIDGPMRKNQAIYCSVCHGGPMKAFGKYEIEGRDGMSGHEPKCPYYLWRKSLEA